MLWERSPLLQTSSCHLETSSHGTRVSSFHLAPRLSSSLLLRPKAQRTGLRALCAKGKLGPGDLGRILSSRRTTSFSQRLHLAANVFSGGQRSPAAWFLQSQTWGEDPRLPRVSCVLTVTASFLSSQPLPSQASSPLACLWLPLASPLL